MPDGVTGHRRTRYRPRIAGDGADVPIIADEFWEGQPNPGAKKPLAQTFARETQIDPDLARVVEAWPQLPEAIRRAVQALAPAGLLGAPCC